MKKGRIFNSKNLMKITQIIIVLFVVISLISSNTISINLDNLKLNEGLNTKDFEKESSIKISSGIAPKRTITNPSIDILLTDNKKNCVTYNAPIESFLDCEIMWGYITNSSNYNEGPCYFDTCDPGAIEFLQYTESDDFLSGGTSCGGYWIACENSTGALWQIDNYGGDMTFIGGGGIGLNGLAYNPITHYMYGASGTDLYEIDPNTGEQVQIGAFGNDVEYMIGMAFNNDGILYGWDLGQDSLWIIDTETGAATKIGPLGIDLNYAQDGDFHRDSDTLYLTAYTTTGQLYVCDEDTGTCTLIGNFEGNSQITASFISHTCPPPPEDVGINEIIKPDKGYANETMEVVISVKNHGDNTLYNIPVNVTILIDGVDEEYNETEYIETLEKHQTVNVKFPAWNPYDWQIVFNEYIDYKITAYTTVKYDVNKNNDYKEKWFELYFPWFHDIEINSIDSPYMDGPGRTYPVNATIKNVGQYVKCCISINVSIGEPVNLETLLSEKSWNKIPPEGWYDEHKDFDPEYGWEKSYTSNSGGLSPEACLSYDKALEYHYFYSYTVDTFDNYLFSLRFKSYIDHYYERGLYSLNAGYSIDGETWYTVWHDEPSFSRKYEVEVPIKGGSESIYIGFWVKGDPYYFNYWYIDDVELLKMSIDKEYLDIGHIETEIFPGEELTFEFEEWTPDFLQYETTGTKDYIIACFIELDGDENPSNNIFTEQFVLNFWYDVGIDEITSPTGGPPFYGYHVCWDNGEPDGRYALPGSMYQGYSNILIDDFEVSEDSYIETGSVHYIWNEGYTSNLKNIKVYIFKDKDECDPSLDEYPELYYVFEAAEFTEYLTGNYYFGRPEVVVDFLLEEEVQIPQGKWYIGIQPVGIIDDIAYILTAPDKGCMVMADLPYWDYPRWTSSHNIWGEEFDLAWGLHCYLFAYSQNAFIKPGTNDIDVIVKNYGTFPKYNLTCYAEIWEYITDPENGTQIYSDKIGNIDLTIPLGGEKELQFEDFTFADEGRYGLFLEFPASPDDNEKNNKKSWGIAVDDTKPESDYPPILDPPYPDGFNSWYVSDVTVTLEASDPWSNGVSSGVKEIRYTVNGGEEKILPRNWGSFLLTEDGDDILVEYWAVDWVGNVETPKNAFTIDIDKTSPNISLAYEVVGGNNWSGWIFTFTAYATDPISGMDYVEFYLNNVLQETIIGSGPEYTWTIKYEPIQNAVFKATAYDKAGNFESEQIKDPTICTCSKSKNNEISSRIYHVMQIPHIR